MKFFILTTLFFLILIVLYFVFFKTLSWNAKLRKAEEYLEEGDISKANNIVKKILDKKKDHVQARHLRAKILIKQNQFLMAIAELNAILNIPNFNKFIREVDIHYDLATLYNGTQSYQKEIEEYKKILSFNPDDLVANHRIGHALYKQKDYRGAKEHFLKAIIIDPNLTDIYLPLGISCFNISDYDKSEEYLMLALKLPGEHSDAHYYLGSIYKMKKDYDNAVKMFDIAKKDRNFFVKSLLKTGEIYFEQGQYYEAIDTLEKGLNNLKKKSEEALEYRYLLAECYELENKIKEAVHHWNKIAAENPNFRSTRLKLEQYKDILENKSLMTLFASSLEELQPILVELISSLNYNIISKEKISPHDYQYKAYNIKRINDPPVLIHFNRTMREISEGNIIEFQKRITHEKCKSGIYLTTSRFSIRAKSAAQSKMIELYNADYIKKAIEKIISRKKQSDR